MFLDSINPIGEGLIEFPQLDLFEAIMYAKRYDQGETSLKDGLLWIDYWLMP